jgi:hypothetical protein
MDGTASLANRDFGRVCARNRRKVVFSGAAHHANEAAGAGYFAASGGESAETGLVGGGKWIRTLGSACLARKRPIFAIFLSPRRNPIEVSPVPVLILKKVERMAFRFRPA